MKKFELMPTEENLIESLRKDFLKRNKDLVRFYELLEAQEEACSIAIDGRWGSGKTFFVKQSRGCGRFLGPELSNSKTASILHRTQTT